MSSEQSISSANLTYIENSLNSLENNVNFVSNQVDVVNSEVVDIRNNLNHLIQEFQDYVKKDLLEKSLQLAETRIVKVRQELETNYGHYGEVRRRVTGILQAVDAGLVKKETIENSTEEHMLAAPRYWLAPCLISLSAWLNDNKELADKAMLEALRRDSEKTSLFFALVTRRGARYKASSEWLDKYFGLQNPESLEREIVILIDGFTNGIFGPSARMNCGRQIESWIAELSQKAGFVEEQNAQWKIALESKLEKLNDQSYPYLKEHSKTWPRLESSLEGAKIHGIIADYFTDILGREVTPAKNIAYAVDGLLDTLVSKFDDEELPLRNDERLLSLIIQENGDNGSAKNLFSNEKTLKERVSFTQLLTNFAMHPEVSNASIVTQKFSLAWSKEWIKHAHDDLTAENRASIPIDIDLEINEWTGQTQDGSNEKELVSSLESYMEHKKQHAISQVKLKTSHWAALVGGVLFAFNSFNTPFLLLFAAACGLYFYLGKQGLQKRKDQVTEDFKALSENSKQKLLASLAETVDWRKEYAREDENASLVTELLDSIKPEQYSFSSHDSARAVVN